MVKRSIFIIFLFMTFLSFAQDDRKIVAVLPFSPRGAIENVDNLINIITDSLASSMSKNYNVIDRTHLIKVLGDLGIQKDNVFYKNTLDEIGKMTNANIVVMGNLTRYDNMYYLSFRGVDLKTGITLFANNTRSPNIKGFMTIKTYENLVRGTKFLSEVDNNKKKVIIPRFESREKKNEPIFMELLTDNFVIAMVKSGKYNLLERSEIDKAMADLRFQVNDLLDKSNMEKIDILKEVDILITGEVREFEKKYFISASGIDIESGIIVFSEKRDFVKNKNLLLTIVDDMANPKTRNR